MQFIQNHLDQAITFIRTSKSFEPARDHLVEQLTQDLIHLDGTKPSPKRREMICVILNVISQLEHLYDETKLSSGTKTNQSTNLQ